MASEQTIQFNYNKALQQADSLLNISNDIRKIATDKLNDSIQAIDKNWDGENSKKFLAKSKKLKDQVEDSADDIRRISDAIKKMAKEIYDAEMESIRIAKMRSYKKS